MEKVEKHQVVINDGVKIRPDWTDRIAISHMPVTEKRPIFSSAVAKQFDVHSDLSGMDLTIVPVITCGKAWDVKAMTGVSLPFEVFADMYTKNVGRYNFRAYQTLAFSPSEINMYFGNNHTIPVWRYENGTQRSFNDYDINITLHPDVVGIWDDVQGTIDYQFNAVFRGSETVVSLGNMDSLILFDDNYMHNQPTMTDGNNMPIRGGDVKFFIKELGCYTRGSDMVELIDLDADLDVDLDVDLDEDVILEPMPVNYHNLTADYTIRKSEQIILDKVHSGGKFYVSIKWGKCGEMIEMGNVWNKPAWTNDAIGQDIAYNEISEWLI